MLSRNNREEESRLIAEVESRTQGSRPRPRTQKNSRPRPRRQKKSEAKDNLSEDRHSRGQGQKCSRPRTKDTSASALQKKKVLSKTFQAISKKKKGLYKNFSGDLHKKRFPKNFSSARQNFNIAKNSAVLESRTGQFSRT